MNGPSVFIVVLNWNSSTDTENCLRSVQRLKYENYHVLVIDNGSEDDSVAQIKGSFPDLELLELEENTGFAGGCNRGIEIATERGFESVLLLNNDAIVRPDTLQYLVEALSADQMIAAVQPKILLDEGHELIWNAGGKLNAFGASISNTSPPISEQPFLADWLTGCCMLIKTQALKVAGLFDDRFFAYHEDVDLSIRLTGRGYYLKVVPQAIVYHEGGSSSTTKQEKKGFQLSPLVHLYNTRNKIFIYRKHFGHLLPILFLVSLVRCCVHFLYFVYRGNREKQVMVWKGFREGWRTKLV